jgi:hypothetical protein
VSLCLALGTLGAAPAYAAITGTTTVSGSETLSFGCNIFSGGTLSIDFGGSLSTTDNLNNLAGGTLGNAGSLSSSYHLRNYGTLTNQTGATFTNEGTLANAAGGALSVAGDLTSSGAITNAGTLDVAAVGQVLGTGSFTQTGGVTTADGLLLAAAIDLQGGSLFGTGTLEGDVTVGAAATLAPGHSPGILTVNGNLALDGTLVMEIDGTAPGTFDGLNVTQGISFGAGSITSIVFDNLFAAAAGMSWDLVQGNAFSGVGNINYQVTGLGSRYTWETYDEPSSGGGFHLGLRVQDAPEPGTLALLALGPRAAAPGPLTRGDRWPGPRTPRGPESPAAAAHC